MNRSTECSVPTPRIPSLLKAIETSLEEQHAVITRMEGKLDYVSMRCVPKDVMAKTDAPDPKSPLAGALSTYLEQIRANTIYIAELADELEI